MSGLVPNKFLKQPQGAFGIDWASPLANGLQLFFDAANRRDLISGSFGTVTGAKVVGSFGWNDVRASGFGATSGTSTDDRITLSSYTQKDGPRTQAVWFYARTDGGGGFARLVTKPTVGDQAGGSDGIALGGTTSIRVWRYNSSNTKLFEELVDVPTLSNLFGCLVVTHDGSTGSGFNFYFNGKSTTSTAATAINAGAADNEPLYIGNRPDLTRCWDGWIGPILQWGRVLSAAEVYQITQNPWQLLAAPRRQMFVVSVQAGYYPASDITTTGWTAYPDPPLYAKIDEATPNDSDYIISPNLAASPGPVVFGLNQSAAAGSYTVTIRAKYTLTAGQVRVSMLDSGGTSVGASAWTSVTGSFTSYALSVTTTGTATQVKIEVQ